MRYLRQLAFVGVRCLPSVLVILSLASVVSAYTLVMRSGRRVQIPDQFSVTKTTLTYEVSQGFQITVQMASIDVAATERANGEQPGALLSRVNQVPVPIPQDTAVENRRATRTVSNRELDPYIRSRRESELAYERRRKELGLPSVEESRQRQQAESESIRQELRERRSADSEAETYWRSRASELRADLAAVDAEIAFVQNRIGEISASNNWIGGVPLGFGWTDYGFGRQRFGNFPRNNVYSSPRRSGSLNRGFRGGPARPGLSLNFGFGSPVTPYGYGGYPSRGFRGRGFGYPGNSQVFGPFQNFGMYGSNLNGYDSDYEHSNLMVRLNELVGQQAALRARWRTLEEEARRAGAPPGWLRP